MFQRGFKNGFLWGSLFAVLAVTHPASAEPTREGADWLFAQFQTAGVVDTINAGTVRGLLQCACYKLARQNQFPEACQGFQDLRREPVFWHAVVNPLGDLVETPSMCDEALYRFVTMRANAFYPVIVKAMSLMQPQHPMDELSITEAAPTFETADNFISTRPVHRLKSLFNRNLVAAAVAPLDSSQIAANLDTYRQHLWPVCLQYFDQASVQRDLVEASEYFKPRLALNGENVCKFLVYRTPLSTDFETASRLLDNVFTPYYQYAQHEMQKFRQDERDEYLERVNDDPLLLLIDKSNPDLLNVAQALKKIDGNAQQRVKDWQQAAAKVRSKQEAYAGRDDTWERYVYGSLYKYAGMENLYIYSQALLKIQGWTPEQIQSQQEAMRAMYDLREKVNSRVFLAAATGLAIACLVAPGRVLSAAVAPVMESGCFVALGLPVNGYMLFNVTKTYSQHLHEFFSTVEVGRGLRTLESMDTDLAMVAFAAGFLPVAGGALGAH
jgi:hypothetical protein